MKTSKPFSTISYNSKDYLVIKLDDFIKRGLIIFYAFIEHLPEEDEKKKHKHLFVIPNGQIETGKVIDDLVEIDNKDPLKPLKCLPVKSSKFFDWYLYSVHDNDYLYSKNQTRKYNYTKDDFVVSDEDFFIEEIHQMDMSKFRSIKAIRSAVSKNIPFDQLVYNGAIPIQQINAYKTAYEICTSIDGQTFRNDRQTHSPLTPFNENKEQLTAQNGYINEITGEIIK